MIKEFKEFIMRGSVLDLAVGVVIVSAFTVYCDTSGGRLDYPVD